MRLHLCYHWAISKIGRIVSQNMRLKADLTLFLVAVLWGSAFVAQRVAGQAGSVYFFNSARFLLAALFLFPFIRSAKIEHGQWLWMAAGGMVLFVASAFQQAGMLTTTAGNAGFITSLYVVFVPFVMLIGWKEKPHWLAVLGVILAGAGAFLLSTAGRFEVQKGDALELAGALFWSLHVVLLGKFAARFEPVSFSAGQLLIGGSLNLVAGLLFEHPDFSHPLAWVAAVVYTAVISIGLGYTLQIWGQRHTPPTDAALILSLESVFAAIGGWLILDEKFVPVQVAGCIVIFVGVVLSQAKGWSKMDIEGR
jgi:drug/metabolite transporter (DMT)-like permease